MNSHRAGAWVEVIDGKRVGPDAQFRCENCRYFYDELEPFDDEFGQCRRLPPIVHRTHHDRPWGEFPRVSMAMWCGEHKRGITTGG